MRKIFAIWLCALLLMSSVVVGIGHSTEAASVGEEPLFSGTGSGTIADPYVITTVEQLQEMNNAKTSHYILGNDIDASATTGWNSGAGFIPIGNSGQYFTGSLNGNNFTISNLFIYRPSTYPMSLFGSTYTGANIANVKVENVNITGTTYTSGFVGMAYGGSGSIISNCHVSGTINGRGYCIGGFAGEVGCSISNCSSSCTVTGTGTGNQYLGGFASYNSGYISNCYATGNVISSTFQIIGGFLGAQAGNSVKNCYSAGDVPDSGTSIGGFIGMHTGGTVSDCYWDTVTSGTSTSAAGTGKTTAEMMQQVTFTSWDFTDVWGIDEGVSYPYLLAFLEESADPVAHWPLDEGVGQLAEDITGNGHNGTLGSTAGVDSNDPTWTSGILNGALNFDGAEDYVEAPFTEDPSEYTMEAWVKPTIGTGRSIIVQTDANGPYMSWSHQLRIDSSGRFVHYLLAGGVKTVTGTTIVVPGRWYHVVGTAVNGGDMALYVNGVAEGGTTAIGTMWTVGDRYRLGSGSGDSMNYFQGTIDEVSIWDRALAAGDVLDRFITLAPVHNLDSDEYFTSVQAAIDDPDTLDGHTIMVDAGTYNEKLTVSKRLTIQGAGMGNTTINGGGSGNVVTVTANWVNITGFKITGSGTAGSTPNMDAGVKLSGVQYCNISGNNITGNRNGVNINGGGYHRISVNQIRTSGYDGIFAQTSTWNRFDNNTIVGFGDSGIWLRDASSNNKMADNFMSAGPYGIYVSGTASSGQKFLGNTITKTTGYAVAFFDCASSQVNGNVIHSNTGYGVYMRYSGSNGNTVSYNTLTGNSNSGIILHQAGNNNKILWNTLVNNGKSASVYDASITVSDTDYTTVANNTAIDNRIALSSWNGAYYNVFDNNTAVNSTSVGFQLSYTYYSTFKFNDVVNNSNGISIGNCWDSNKIIANNISSNRDNGIYMSQCGNNFLISGNMIGWNGKDGVNMSYGVGPVYKTTLSGNTIRNNGGSGIVQIDGYPVFTGSSTYNNPPEDNIFSNNLVAGNARYGVYFVDALRSKFHNNTVEGNGLTGIHSQANIGCRYYHNNIIGNGVQAYESSASNHWNASYPNGGNYWSDYAGVDAFSGANQDIAGSDGFGDAARPVGAGTDRHPLMFQSNWWSEVAPTITLVSPADSGVYNSGTLLDIYIWDADFNLDLADYSINGGLNTAFGVNYDIGTTGWAEGDYVIEVNAADKLGNAAQETFNIRVDDTDPTFTVELSMSVDLNGNGLLETGDTLAIWVNVTDANEDATTAPSVDVDETDFPDQGVAGLAYLGSGAWQCTYTVQAGGFNNSDIDVTFADKAGNLLTKEDSITFRVNGQKAMSFISGWNLISFPMDQPTINGVPVLSADELATQAGAIMVSKWDSAAQRYINYIPGFHTSSDPENFAIGPDDAIFVYSAAAKNLNVSGYRSEGQRSVDLVHGWNLVGYRSLDAGSVKDDWAAQVSCGDYDDICYWDGTTFVHYIFPETVMALEPGRGYFVWSDGAVTLTY